MGGSKVTRQWVTGFVLTVPLLAVLGISTAKAGPINDYANGPWLEFVFRAVGTIAEPCVTPNGSICLTFDANTVLLSSPAPWTFSAGPGGATITVVDAFSTGDRFAVYDNGNSLGMTSEVAPSLFCGATADQCLNGTGGVFGSSGAFPVGPGPHEIEIRVVQSPFGAGTGYLRVDGDVVGLPPPPPADSDGDGLPDDQDACPTSDLTPTVRVGTCDSGVPNTLSPAGCTILDGLHSCGNGVRNHGMNVSCASRYLDSLQKTGVISGGQHGAIQACVAQTK